MSERLEIASRFGTYAVEFGEARADPGTIVCVDERVAALHDLGVPAERLLHLRADETAKDLRACEELAVRLVQAGLRRGDRLAVAGGGVAQDVAGFVASVYHRGIAWEFFPTTLLAQADSCVGGKTSINVGDLKNLLGTFHPPSRIVVDIRFLDTLGEPEIRSGIGEMMHFFLVAGSPTAGRLVADIGGLLRDRSALRPYIVESLTIKAATVARDEFDRGERQLFNYGHTFGHALETVTAFAVPHGQAVTLGMDLANLVSVDQGLLDRSCFDEMHALLEPNLPRVSAPDPDAYLAALSKDKKNDTDGAVTCILTRGPGAMEKRTVPLDARMRGLVAGYFEAYT